MVYQMHKEWFIVSIKKLEKIEITNNNLIVLTLFTGDVAFWGDVTCENAVFT
jgi:hypothetical protein